MHNKRNFSNSSIFTSRIRPHYSRTCKHGSVTSIDNLSDDLLSVILVRLEAGYLYENARPVSRRWLRIINSDAFRKSHLQHSPFGLLLSDIYGGGHPMLLAVSQGGIQKCDFSYKCKTHLSGSFHGLAMEMHRNASDEFFLQILNPATKKPFKLPHFPLHRGRRMWSGTFGVGFALNSLHYKVALTYISEMGDSVSWELAILTVGVDQSWRFLPVGHLSEASRSVLCLSPMITEGYMHWAEGRWTEFLTLDVEAEILTICHIPLHPDEYLNARWFFLSTGTSLTALVAHGNLVWEVWSMEHVSQEWRKHPDDIHFGGLEWLFKEMCAGQVETLWPFGWINYPKVLAFHFRGRSNSPIFFSYHLDTRHVEFLDLTEPCAYFHAVVHKSSLICLP